MCHDEVFLASDNVQASLRRWDTPHSGVAAFDEELFNVEHKLFRHTIITFQPNGQAFSD